MHSILKWFTGLTFAVIQLEGNDVKYCNCPLITDKVQVHCYCVNTVTFPPELDEHIAFIKNLTMMIYKNNSDIIKFETNHLNKFNLTKLEIIADGVDNLGIPSELLKPLTNLEILNLNFLQVKPPLIPTSVKVLIANSVGNASHPDMTQLDNLESLSFSSNFLDDFPKVSRKALLYEVNLTGNSLRNMTYNDIAPYCLMRVLIVKGSLIERDTEKCCGIKTWTIEANIFSDIHCGEEDANCDSKVKEHGTEANDLYYNCLSRTDAFQPVTAMEFFFHILFSLALILALSFLVYRYYGSHAVKTFRESKKVENLPKLHYSNEEEEESEDTSIAENTK